jgi:hypothetical protein
MAATHYPSSSAAMRDVSLVPDVNNQSTNTRPMWCQLFINDPALVDNRR